MSERIILLIEDEAKIRDVLRAYLVREGFRVCEAEDGKKGLEQYDECHPDLILLDMMLPVLSGERVAAAIRQKGDTPIIMLTARSEEWERLQGFELGADDYITKPFSPREVVARIRAVLKRAGRALAEDEAVIRAGDLELHPESRTVFTQGQPLPLTATEFDLLFELLKHPGKVYRRAQLAAIVLGYDYESMERTIDSHIKNLRRKLGVNARIIETVHGVGYRSAPGSGE
ncbi:MAG: response regulator transcription factor [Spirochaetota bacterium]|nr:response regulator transcription factor [Spirochaetota bacterium]